MERNNTSTIELPREAAVVVKDAFKKYADNIILKGLNMEVARGTIYGLLGPSGCGKTTLLSCIVSRQNLDSGSIHLSVKSKAKIGYMPQELSLFKEFSIRETFAYFGCIFGLSSKELDSRTDELLGFLELPPASSIVSQLSGGQQRRVSLCVALLHDPELLILDEPTVGVDPILCHNIWQKLMHMSLVGRKTIILTTHYIEEAKAAHTIGLMRGGVLLAEDNPNSLITEHNCDTLEQVFLRLSHKQSNGQCFNEDDNLRVENYPKPERKPLPAIQESNAIVGRRVRAQFLKGMIWMKRNIPIMMFLMALPYVQCTLFNYTIGLDPKGLTLALVNDELKTWKTDCTQFSVTCGDYPLSCIFLKELQDHDIILNDYGDLHSARIAVKSNQAWGVLHFHSNYTSNLIERFQMHNHASDEALDFSELNVWMDMSNQYIGNMLKWNMFNGYISFLESVFNHCGWPTQVSKLPVIFQDAVYGSNQPSFVHFAVPAVLQLFMFYLPMMFTVGALIMEKREGMLERSLVAGITLKETILSHIIIQYLVLLIQTIIMLLVLFVQFDNPLRGSFSVFLLLLFLIGTNGMCYGFFVSTFCETDTAATYLGLGSFFPMAMLSGMFWPFEGMHYLLRSIGIFLPLTMATEAMRSIMIRAWPITHPVVYRGFLSVIGWILFFTVVTLILFKFHNGLRGRSK